MKETGDYAEAMYQYKLIITEFERFKKILALRMERLAATSNMTIPHDFESFDKMAEEIVSLQIANIINLMNETSNSIKYENNY